MHIFSFDILRVGHLKGNMNKKEIQAHLKKVYDSLNKTLGELPNSVIAGGAIASLVLDSAPNDYDVWFDSKYAWTFAVDLVKKKGLEIVKESAHVLTFMLPEYDAPFQFCRIFINDGNKVRAGNGDFDRVVSSFDFLHTRAMYSPNIGLKFLDGNSVEYIQSKELGFTGNLNWPTKTIQRLQKFALRGYKIPDATIHSILRAVKSSPQKFIDDDIAGSTDYNDAKEDLFV